MFEWFNFIILISSALLLFYFYARSVSPAALEKRFGKDAYRRCTKYRLIASVFEFIALANYVIYFFHPLPVGLPLTFPWEWWISAVVAVAIAVPGGYVWFRGMKDAGEESIFTKKEHTLYGGIYKKIRHPQAAGEVTYWWVIAFLLNSPFLALFSFVWLPIFYVMCLAEEKDLIIRYGKPYLDYRKETGFVLPKRNK